MDQRIVQFVAALRAMGARVSLAESADAFQALQALGIQDRELFRLALRSTLVKESRDLEFFDQLFPYFFSGEQVPEMQNLTQDLTPEEAKMLAEALRQFTQRLRQMLNKLLQGQPLSPQELNQLEQITGLDQVADLRYQHWMERQMERAMRFKEVRQALHALMELLEQLGMNRQKVEQLRQAMLQNQEALRQQLNQFAGQRLAENMSERSKGERRDNLYNKSFDSLTEEEMHQLKREVRRLAAMLRTRLALRLKRARNGKLDVKGTLRTNLKYGGVPVEIKHLDRSLKPKIVVICDISTSMRPVSELMLSLLYAIQDQVSKTHAFAFIDHLEYITPEFEGRQPGEAIAEVLHRLPSGYYNTDLGFSLQMLWRDYLDTVDHRSTFLIVGDGRNNYNDPRLDLFRQLARRSRQTIWFNPEPPILWGSGDSDMLLYAPLCDATFQVATLNQLAAAVDRMLLGNLSADDWADS